MLTTFFTVLDPVHSQDLATTETVHHEIIVRRKFHAMSQVHEDQNAAIKQFDRARKSVSLKSHVALKRFARSQRKTKNHPKRLTTKHQRKILQREQRKKSQSSEPAMELTMKRSESIK